MVEEKEVDAYREDDFKDLEPYDLHQYFIVASNIIWSNSDHFQNRLKTSPRYETDAAYRVTVDVLVFILKESYGEESLPLCLNLMFRASNLNLGFLVAQIWLSMGIIYSHLNMMEKGVECFSSVIETEKKNGLSTLTNVAYANLGMIYAEIKEYKKCVDCLGFSISDLEARSPHKKRNRDKLFHNYNILFQVYTDLKDYDKAEEIYAKLGSFDKRSLNPISLFLLAVTELAYRFLFYGKERYDFDDCKEALEEARRLLPPNQILLYYKLLTYFVSHSREYGVEPGLYEDIVLEMLSCYHTGFDAQDYDILYEGIHYYELIKDRESLRPLYMDFKEAAAKMMRQFQSSKSHSLNIVETLSMKRPEKDEMRNENTELRLLYKESMEAKKKLVAAYERIELISNLGRRMTSMTDIGELIKAFNEMLKTYIDFDSFSLFMVDEEKGVLRSLIFEFIGNIQPTLEIPLTEEKSLNAKCYREKKLLSIEIGNQIDLKHLSVRGSVSNGNPVFMSSAVYLPLIVHQDVIGVYTLQHRKKNVYEDKLGFLEEITPYMSIALNNAMRSWRLEQEIESHIETQNQLKEANLTLKKLSLLDGLTHINSRRFFEKKILNLLVASKRNQSGLTILMIDIDDFKLYNDTYGHLEGDAALQAVASVFRKEMEKVGGISSRFGGEEFVGACSGLSLEESCALGESIRSAVYALNIRNREALLGRVSVSIGISCSRGLGPDAKSHVLKAADEMLYKAKNIGKNRIMIQSCEEKP